MTMLQKVLISDSSDQLKFYIIILMVQRKLFLNLKLFRLSFLKLERNCSFCVKEFKTFKKYFIKLDDFNITNKLMHVDSGSFE